ncbi:hypothetical protein ElyMa_006300600 [Elysia marginata]|uniref:Uncharacterized protein n=1 Tax=Elysia marginata TaxID=1093978 RepID=A0AAV4HIG9_9GAST|nr:hypothetical protein ElyMa_006300600 [Elysia marginata]
MAQEIVEGMLIMKSYATSFKAWNRVYPVPSKISRTDALIPRPEQSSQRTKLIMTYHPHNLVARKIVLNNLSVLQADPDAREVFDEPPLVVYRRAKNIRDMLVRSRISASRLRNHTLQET